jgi:hypothetical protein
MPAPLIPLLWTVFVLCAVAAFVVIAAYWLDIQDRPDLTRGQRMAWSAGVLLFPFTIPGYAFLGGPGWPWVLRAGSFLPAIGLALFFCFLFGIFS